MNKREEERKKRQQEKLEQELSRLEAMSVYEREYEERGLICGIDEVGRGPLAGPVVAAAVLLPPGCLIEGVDDSKKLSERKREQLYERIREKAVAYGVGWVGPERIDEINILQPPGRLLGWPMRRWRLSRTFCWWTR